MLCQCCAKTKSLEIYFRVYAILVRRSRGEFYKGELNALKLQVHSVAELKIAHAEFHTEAYSIRGLKMPNI